MARSVKESGMGQIDPYQNEKSMGKSSYSRADKMSTRCSSIHSAYAHCPRPRRKSSRKEVQHTCGTVKGKNEGIVDSPPYSIGLCPIL